MVNEALQQEVERLSSGSETGSRSLLSSERGLGPILQAFKMMSFAQRQECLSALHKAAAEAAPAPT